MTSFLYQHRIICEDGSEYLVEIFLPQKPLRLQNITTVQIGNPPQLKISIMEATPSKEVIERMKQEGTYSEPANDLLLEYRVPHSCARISTDSKLGRKDEEGSSSL